MSQQIEEIISKNKKLFRGFQRDIEEYLLKYYERNFQRQKVLKVERIDATERIKKSGFNKNLSSWRNIYQNVIISNCFIENDEQRRYDYKFHFTKEILDEATIERIEEGLKECDSLNFNFNFDDALAKIDDMLESIRKKKDDVFNKILNDKRVEILKAKNKNDKELERLKKLEEKIKIDVKYDDLKAIIADCEKIIPLAKTLRKRDLVKKYSDLLEKTKKRIADQITLEKKLSEEEKKALEEKRALEKQKALEEKQALKEKRALEKVKALEEKEAIGAQKVNAREKNLEEKQALKEKKKLAKQKAQDEKNALKEKKRLEKQKALEEKKALEAQEKARLLEEKKVRDEQEALEKQKALEKQRRQEEKRARREQQAWEPRIKKIKIICYLGAILMIISAIANISLVFTTIYRNIIVTITGESSETFFIFLYCNGCISMLGGILVIFGSIEMQEELIGFGIATYLLGSVMFLLVGIWAGYLCGDLYISIIIYAIISFSIGFIGVLLAISSKKRIERIKNEYMEEQLLTMEITESSTEISTTPAFKTSKNEEDELMKYYELETGKKAIWRGNPTKGYLYWKKGKLF